MHLLVGYGTLLNTVSLGDTVGQAAATSKRVRPVVIEGWQRAFELRPDHYEPCFFLSDRPIEAAAMNVRPGEGTSARSAHFNGLALTVDDDELARLDARERYYERARVRLRGFPDGEDLGWGMVYAASIGSRWLERDPEKLLPLWRDIVWARQGAYRVGPEFGRLFDETTYVAGGRVLVRDHYARYLNTPPTGLESIDPPSRARAIG